MRRRITIVTGAALAVLSLAACTSAPVVAPTPTAAGVIRAPANNRSYTVADLGSILSSVNASLGLAGSLESQGGNQSFSINAIDPLLAQPGAQISPAGCAAFLKSDGRSLDDLGTTNLVAATLSSSVVNLIATTVNTAPLPAAAGSAFATKPGTTLAACHQVTATVTVGGSKETIDVTINPITARTDVRTWTAFTESAVIGGDGSYSSSSWTTVEAVDGNLVLFASSVGDPSVHQLERAIDATVHAAAK